MPYYSPHAGAIANLIRLKGQAQAEATARSGEIWSRGLANLGDIVGGSVAQMARWNADAPQRQLVDLRLKGAEREEASATALRSAWEDAGGDAETAIGFLKERGQPEAALQLEHQVSTLRASALAQETNSLNATAARLNLASRILPIPPDQVENPEQLADFSAEYASSLPYLKKTLGEDLSARLPGADDPHLVEKVRKLHDLGMTLQEKIQARIAAVQYANEGLKFAKDSRERDDYFTKALGHQLSTIDNQDDWISALKQASDLGAPPAVLEKFGQSYSTEASKKAGLLALAPKESYDIAHPKAVQGTTLAADQFRVAQAAKEEALGRKLSEIEVDQLWNEAVQKTQSLNEPLYPVIENGETVWRERSVAKGESVGPRNPSSLSNTVDKVTARAAETWRANKLNALEVERRKGGTQQLDQASGQWVTVPAMADAVYKAEKARIESDYQRMLKGAAAAPKTPPRATTPAVVPASVPQAAPPVATPPPAATPPASTAASGEVPYPVQKILAGQKAGDYELTDGSKWHVAENGTITKQPD